MLSSVSGPQLYFYFACSGEEFTLSGDEVTVDHITEAGDCAHDALDDNNVELKGITYDESKDEITVSVKYSVLSLDIVLGHQAASHRTRARAHAPSNICGL